MAQLKDDCFAFGGDLTNIDVALKDIDSRLSVVCETEEVKIKDAYNRIAAENVISKNNVPPNNNAAVDGYVVRFDDLNIEGETRLPVTARVTAGHPKIGKIGESEAVRIFTGAPIPPGFGSELDTVFMDEDCKLEDGFVILPPGLKRGSNRRLMGEDIKCGETIISKGWSLRSQDVALIASIGQGSVTVYKPLRVAVFSSGDEVFDPNQQLPNGCIFDANRFAIIGLLNSLNCEVTDLGILPDKKDVIADSLVSVAPSHDMIVTSGGVSAGEEDHIKEAVEMNGSLNFWRFAIKPGRPVALGQLGHTAFVGLPGNPVAAMVTFMMIARPMIKRLSGERNFDVLPYKVESNFEHKKKLGRREWVRSKLSVNKKGNLILNKFKSGGSGILSSMVGSDGLVELDERVEKVSEGDMLTFLPFSDLMQ